MIFQYRHPEFNEELVIGADPSEGNDNSTFVVISKKYADVILISKSKEESPQLGYALGAIGNFYKKHTNLFPAIAPERNTGIATIHVLKELNYPNIFRMPSTFVNTGRPEEDKYGWLTSSSTRPKMLDDLSMCLRQKALKIPSKHIVEELFSFIRHQKTGKAQADQGAKDDLVMATAIAWQLYELAPTQQVNYVAPKDDISNRNWGLR